MSGAISNASDHLAADDGGLTTALPATQSLKLPDVRWIPRSAHAVLVGCATFVAALAVLSYFRTDHFGTWRRTQGRALFHEECHGLVSQRGALVIASESRQWPVMFGAARFGSGYPHPEEPLTFDRSGWLVDPSMWGSNRFAPDQNTRGVGGIVFRRGISLAYGETGDGWSYRVPSGYIIVALLAWPATALVRRVARAFPKEAPICATCGNGPRETLERCPTCGTETSP